MEGKLNAIQFTNFNSTMVRLKESLLLRTKPRLINFNATMGRLKEFKKETGRPFTTEFQFHYGTIKRKTMIYTPLNKINFNSTMVRLKELLDCTIEPKYCISIPLWYD